MFTLLPHTNILNENDVQTFKYNIHFKCIYRQFFQCLIFTKKIYIQFVMVV